MQHEALPCVRMPHGRDQLDHGRVRRTSQSLYPFSKEYPCPKQFGYVAKVSISVIHSSFVTLQNSGHSTYSTGKLQQTPSASASLPLTWSDENR